MKCIKGHTLHASVDYCGCNDCRDFTPDAATGCANLQQPPCPECGHPMGEHDSRDGWCHHVIDVGGEKTECTCVPKPTIQEQKHCTSEEECPHRVDKEGCLYYIKSMKGE